MAIIGRSRGARFLRWPDQGFGGDAELAVQLLDHLQRQRPLAVEDFVDAVGAADHWLQILHGQRGKAHSVARVGRVRREAP